MDSKAVDYSEMTEYQFICHTAGMTIPERDRLSRERNLALSMKRAKMHLEDELGYLTSEPVIPALVDMVEYLEKRNVGLKREPFVSEHQRAMIESAEEVLDCLKYSDKTRRGVIFLGNPGTAKTLTVAAMLRTWGLYEIAQKRIPVYKAYHWTDLADAVVHNKQVVTEKIKRSKVVVINEVRPKSYKYSGDTLLVRQFLFDLIMRWELWDFWLLMTTNFNWGEFQEYLGDNAKTAEAATDRLRTIGRGVVISDITSQR